MSHLPRNRNLSWAKLFFLLKKLYPNAFVNGWRRSLVAMAQRARCYFVQLWCLRALCSVRQHWSFLVPTRRRQTFIWSLLPLLERGKHQRARKDAWSQSWAMSRRKYRPALWLMKHHQAAYSTISWEVSFYLTSTGAPSIDYYPWSVVSFS